MDGFSTDQYFTKKSRIKFKYLSTIDAAYIFVLIE